MNLRSTSTRMLAVTMLAGLTLVACQSEPGNRRVALDMVESLDQLPEAQRDCMTEKIEAYDDDTLDAIASENAEIDFSGMTITQMREAGSDAWDGFVDDLSECMSDDTAASTGSSTPTDDTTTDDTAAADDPATESTAVDGE